MVTYPLMMKWGCPYDCNFCSVIKMFGRKLRSRSVENVMHELRLASPERVFFYDDIFIVDKKQSKALFRQMIEDGMTPMWTAQIRADSLYKSKTTLEPDHELLALMRDSGCYMVYVGFESITQEGLDSYNKKQKVEHITTRSSCSTTTTSACTGCSSSAPTPTPRRRCAPRSTSRSSTRSTRSR